MKIIGVIPARYASSRFPGKPLANIHGKPMIWWVYQQAIKVQEFSEVVVATDDERITSACHENNLRYVMTSDKHETGTDRVAEVADKLAADVYVNVQGDEPLIEPSALSQLAGTFASRCQFASLCNLITDEREIASSNTVKVVLDADGNALYMSRSIIPSGLKGYKGKMYRHVGIYAYTREVLRMFSSLPQSELELAEGIEPLRVVERGIKLRMLETSYLSVGVDTQEDLERVCNMLLPPPP